MARIDLKNHMIDTGIFCVVYAVAFAVAPLFFANVYLALCVVENQHRIKNLIF